VDQRFGQLATYSKQKASMIQAHLASAPPAASVSEEAAAGTEAASVQAEGADPRHPVEDQAQASAVPAPQ
ncbi:unnamed protein product, partial [Symbiodinium pilosum]